MNEEPDPQGHTRLVLASGSPRRRELLGSLGLDFDVRPVDLDESTRPDETPRDYVLRLAREKAGYEVAAREVVLAADTAVVIDGDILGKPEDDAHSREMLKRLAGREHQVLTGVAVARRSGDRVDVRARSSESTVWFTAMEESELDWYVATGEGLDKAGAYAIQGLGAWFVDKIQGNYSNIVGLPLPVVYRLLLSAGLAPLQAELSPRP